jgi:DMSO/TMAO reductase YedYZ molybdopterin-dependent catalytic subunit
MPAQQTVDKSKLIVRSANPRNLETPVQLLNTWITPNELFYVRSHADTPRLDQKEWRLQVDGEVNQSLSLTMEDLRRFPETSQVVTLECSGNGRAFFEPKVPGVQWERGAVGTARWTGARLADVLKKAGIKTEGKHVMMDGADGPGTQKPDFVRSLPLEKAMHPDTLLAYQMNAETLPIPHGYPLRVIVPGWTGNHCMKWLTHLRVIDHEFEGDFMQKDYRIPRRYISPGASVPPAQTKMITNLMLKSLITSPVEGALLKPGRVRVTGVAYGSEARILGVEISTDFGRSWQPATFGRSRSQYAWRLWEYAWEAKDPGSYLILSRARDDRGHTQPLLSPWNPSGYLWNAIDRVRADVA